MLSLLTKSARNTKCSCQQMDTHLPKRTGQRWTILKIKICKVKRQRKINDQNNEIFSEIHSKKEIKEVENEGSWTDHSQKIGISHKKGKMINKKVLLREIARSITCPSISYPGGIPTLTGGGIPSLAGGLPTLMGAVIILDLKANTKTLLQMLLWRLSSEKKKVS